ncbi:hypothetical protein DSL72_002207 [Monilinia vaccinii-corymbosi]|uniref:SHSP domain-containing protein n=1 Tax=Monilinia vaccinii-corymbosi TaxID=61207 RepID=A0A8A3PC30_9HELO|nr:hypothetical protein DSL72_002207 [Monilinia vaccinii-corymbosi]
MEFNHQNSNQQAGPLWDFIRSTQPQNSGAGVDHPSQNFNMWGPPEGPHGPHGLREFSPFPFGFPFGGPGPRGRGGFGPRGGHRGRQSFSSRRDGEHYDGEGSEGCRGHGHHGRGEHTCRGEEESGEETPTSDTEARESRPHHGPLGGKNRRGHFRTDGELPGEEPSDVDAREGSQGPESCRGPKHHGRHGPGSRGGRGVRGGGRGGSHGGPHGRAPPHHWGGPQGNHGRHGPPPFAGPGGPFDFTAIIQALSSHPIAQAFGMSTPQRSGETLVPEGADTENSFVPPIDVFTTENAYVLHIALPGAKKEDVGVHWDAEKGILNVAGVVYRQGDEKFLESLTKKERKVGAFERTMKLPLNVEDKSEIDGDSITAKLEDGVLVVNVPKVEKEESWTEVKRVDIN